MKDCSIVRDRAGSHQKTAAADCRERSSTMKRWLVVAAIVLASAAAYVQAGREQQQSGGAQAQAGRGGQGGGAQAPAGRGGRGQGGGGGRGVVSTADLTVLDGWGRPLTDPLAGGKT